MREVVTLKEYYISIHALRVEGDKSGVLLLRQSHISIHALRVEGDDRWGLFCYFKLRISIHALRVEGDATIPFFNVAP